MDTYLLTNLDKIGADSTLHEWQLDSLAAATLNAALEGDDAQYGSIDQPTRMKNYLQISTKALVITNTMEAVKKAGRKSEMTRQLMKKMKEFKRDVEKALIGNQAASAGTHTSGRTSAGMESWIASTDHGGNGIRVSTTLATSTIGY